MKTLTIILILMTGQSFAQVTTLSISGTDSFGVFADIVRLNVEWESKYETKVLNEGNKDCQHNWVQKRVPFSGISCAVYHDARGCPNDWKNDFRVCKICLRHENIIENRVAIKTDSYEDIVSKIKPK